MGGNKFTYNFSDYKTFKTFRIDVNVIGRVLFFVFKYYKSNLYYRC